MLVAPALAWFGPTSWGPVKPAALDWVVPGLAIALGAGLAAIHRHNAGLWCLAAMLSAAASSMFLDSRSVLDLQHEFEEDTSTEHVIDLTREAMPQSPPAHVAVRGYLRDAWVLDEYAVAPDELPDQSEAANAVLVPLVGTTEQVVTLQGAIVVARLAPGRRKDGALVTLRGTTRSVPEPVVQTLLQITGVPPDAEISAVMVDTLEVPSADRARTRAAIAGLLLLIGLTCAWAAPSSQRRA